MSPPGEKPPAEAVPGQSDERSLLTQASVGVVRLTLSGEIVAANDAFAELVSYPQEALIGEPFSRLLTTSPPPLEAMLSDGVADGDSVTVTLPIADGSGEIIGCEAHFTAVSIAENADGSIVAVLYRRAERAGSQWGSQESETAPARAFVALADALSDGIIVLDAQSQIQYANPAVERILGIPPDELVGGSKLSIIPERLREVHLNALNRYLETGRKNIDWEYVELPGQHNDGHEVPLGISLNDFFFNGDRYFVGLFRDISPRKEAERALRKRERRLNQYKEYTSDVLDAIDDVFYVLDETGDLQRWNRTLSMVTGYTDEEIATMHVGDLFEADGDASIDDAIDEGFETGHARVEVDLLTEDGEAIPYEFVASALSDPDGNPVLAGISRDVTDRKERRRELEASNERLEQFAYAASHDLQEPLRMVTSYLGLIEQRYGETLGEDGEEFLEYAVDGAERMRKMIDGLLTYSRVDTQGEPMGPVDLNEALDDVTDDLRLRIEETDATIRAEELPVVFGDGGQLRQVFQNLLANAIGYSGDEPPEITVSADREGERWTIAVRDAGIGIEPDETERIFRVFQRAQTETDRDGTGIGLALCRRIVERHDGRIWVESDLGDGSTFFFTLPDAPDE